MNLSDDVDICIGLIGIVGAIGAWWKWVRPRWRRFCRKVVAAVDSLAGRDAVTDSITGQEISPALPSIGMRMAAVEHSSEISAVAIQKLVDQQEHMIKMGKRVDQHDADIAELKAAMVERVVGKAESIAMYRTIETAIKATPDVDGDAVDEAE